jgi:uncharacterized NAD(P)/FAD-binding protein YdhS
MTRVVIVGGGASGVLLAAHLLRGAGSPFVVTIVEQRAELGAGVAYATKDPDHLLNVRAANMSAFSDEPEHFFRWLRANVPWSKEAVAPPSAASFAPRRVYREYLESLLAPHIGQGRLQLVRARAVGVTDGEEAATVVFEDGSSLAAERVVVATGNEGPRLPPAPWRHDGWTSSPLPSLSASAPVAIIGTGLTMVDWALTLLHGGHAGAIIAISPRGLMPHAHRAVSPALLDQAALPVGAPLSLSMHWLRSWIDRIEEGGGDWRAAIDALRPHTQRLWQGLSLEGKRRFLRHGRAYWDQHRHRVAPRAAETLRAAAHSGQFSIVAGRVLGFEERPDGVDILVSPRGRRERRSIFARAVFECRGRINSIGETENPLLSALLASGLARPDSLHLGLDVSADGAIVDREGVVSRRLHAIGPVTSGVFWEVTAVPDIRIQAAGLARTFLSNP